MKEVIKLYRESIKIFRENMSDFVGYKLLTSSILFLILMPGFKWVFNIFMKMQGLDYLANGLLKKFILSPQGIILAIISILIGFTTVLLDLGGTIVISHQRIAGVKGEGFIDIIKYSLGKIKYLLGIDGLIIVFYFVIIAPFFDSNLKVGIFESLKIPGFIMDVINSNAFYSTTLMILVILIAYLSIRWMFSLHVLLLSKNIDKRFLRASSKIIEKNYKKVFKTLIILAILEFAMILLLIIIYGIISLLVLVNVDESSLEMGVIIVFSLALVMAFIYASFALPLTIIRMTMIYHNLNEIEVKALDVAVFSSKRMGEKLLNNKSIAFVISIALVIATIGYSFILEESFNQTAYKVAITAHRGSSKEAPENTLSAIKKAASNKADYAEIDVQLTKDKKIILLHDSSFLRTSGLDKKPSQMLYKDIIKLDVGKWFSDEFEGERIATLKEVIDFSRGKLKLNIELKATDISPDLIDEVIKLIESEKFENDCVITSLNYDDLLKVERKKPSLKTGYIMFVAIGQLEHMVVDFYSVEETNVSEAFVSRAHNKGREVHVWTINKEESMRKMIDLGVDNIITDNDDVLRSIIEKKIEDRTMMNLFKNK